MSDKKEIVICLGSSCFARGNKQTVKNISAFIKDNQLENKINFHGAHCFGHCEKGPIVKVESTMHENVDQKKVTEILNETFEIE